MALRVLSSFSSTSPWTCLRLLRGNIANWQGDCIVNAANTQLELSNLPDYWRHIARKDVNSAVHAAAGPGLAEECARLPEVLRDLEVSRDLGASDRVASDPSSHGKVRCPRGEARITGGHDLAARSVIHAVGPDYDTSVRCAGSSKAVAAAHEQAERLLDATYASIFDLANQEAVHSIALPAISCGVYGFGGFDSVDPAARVSIDAALKYAGCVQRIDFVLFDDATVEAWEAAAGQCGDLKCVAFLE